MAPSVVARQRYAVEVHSSALFMVWLHALGCFPGRAVSSGYVVLLSPISQVLHSGTASVSFTFMMLLISLGWAGHSWLPHHAQQMS
jgi:hypothetical protein